MGFCYLRDYHMNGKGSGRRPMSTGLEQFEDNWNRAFSKKEAPPQQLREINHDRMWQHSCTVDMSVVWLGKNETCDFCGAWEEDGF